MGELKILASEEVTSAITNDSKIIQALLDFKDKYAWDKSLFTPGQQDDLQSSLLQDQTSLPYVHSNTYLDEFLESYKQKLAVEQHREVAKV